MSSSPFNTPFVLNIKPSFQKWLFLIIPHALVGFVILLAPPLDYTEKGVAIALVVASFVYYYRLHIRTDLNKSVKAVRLDSAKNWGVKLQFFKKSQDYTNVILLGSSFYSNFLIILNFSDLSQNSVVKATYSVLITPDSLSKDEFRRLKVRLKTLK